ncbi:MAG: hypothetical protein R6V03_11045 [Kiritimatiellia bacterium]
MESGVYLIVGDEYLADGKGREIVDSLVSPEDRDFGLEIVEGRAENTETALEALGRCVEALRTPGFLGSGKTVWLRNAGFLSESTVGRSSAVKESVNEIALLIKEGLPGGQALVITAPRADKRWSIYKACKAAGELYEFAVSDKPYMAEKQAMSTAKEMFRKSGLRIGEDALNAFVEKTGTDSRFIASEIEKMKVFVGEDREAGIQDVRAITSSGRSALAWDLADAFGKRDAVSALGVLRQLIFQKENPIGLIIAIENRIRELLIYREALDNGWLVRKRNGRKSTAVWRDVPPEAEERFSTQMNRDPRKTHPYRTFLLALQAKKFSRRRLEACLDLALEAHEQLVRTSVPPETVLEILLMKCIGQKKSGGSIKNPVDPVSPV